MIPICLKKKFADRYKIDVDPAFHAEGQTQADRDWLYVIPCENGGKGAHIYSHGDCDGAKALAFCGTSTKGDMCDRLLALPDVQLVVKSDMEWIVAFPLAAFDAVAALVKPRKRRTLSQSDQQALIQAGEHTRFISQNQVAKVGHFAVGHGVQGEKAALEATITPAAIVGPA